MKTKKRRRIKLHKGGLEGIIIGRRTENDNSVFNVIIKDFFNLKNIEVSNNS